MRTLDIVRRGAALGGLAVGLGVLAVLALGATALPEEERPRLLDRAAPASPAAVPGQVSPAEAVDAACRGRRPPERTPVQSSAPRSALGVSSTAQLGLRDGSLAGAKPVTAEVVDPSGRRAGRPTVLTGPAWSYLSFPGDFAGVADTMVAGTYRVDWRAEDGTALACDGFVVAVTP